MVATIRTQQRASSQPNLLKYATQSYDPSLNTLLSNQPARGQGQAVEFSSSSAPEGWKVPQSIATPVTANDPHALTARTLCLQLSHLQTQQQSAALPCHGRLHRQLTPHLIKAPPTSHTHTCGAIHTPARPITRHRSFLLPHANPLSVGGHGAALQDMSGSMSTCSGLSSELTNAIEHQSASARSSMSRQSNFGGIRRSSCNPNSLDMSRSSVESASRDSVDPVRLNGFCSSSHRSSIISACPVPVALAFSEDNALEDKAAGDSACVHTEAARASSKLFKFNHLHYTADASLPSFLPDEPSFFVESVCTSDDCLPGASEGSAKSHGTFQRLPLPDSGTNSETGLSEVGCNDKRNSQLLSLQRDTCDGVHKVRDPSSAIPRNSCRLLDVARHVQQYAGRSESDSLGGVHVLTSSSAQEPLGANLPSQRLQDAAALESHAVNIRSCSSPAQEMDPSQHVTACSHTLHAGSSHTTLGSLQSTMQTSGGQPALQCLQEEPHSADVAAWVRRSDVSEGEQSSCTTVFGSPVLIVEVQAQQEGKPFSIPEGSVLKAVEHSNGHRMAFSSSLFQQAQKVPAYPCTQRGGIPSTAPLQKPPSESFRADSIDAQRVYRGPSNPPLPGPSVGDGASLHRNVVQDHWAGAPHHGTSEHDATTTPRTSSDPVCRSIDVAFESDLNMRVARSRQTMDFAARQRIRFGSLSCAELTIMEALALMETLPRASGQQAISLSATAHAFLCAQWCIHEFPGRDWAPLVGLMHDLGRLLLHPKFGSEPAWAVTSESYPLGCRFSESISGFFFLHACPDRRCSAYATPTGVYSANCGLDATHFTWTAPEYLSLVASQNGMRLPSEAMFLLRYQNFESAIGYGAYSDLMSEDDGRCMHLLRKFSAVRRAAIAGAGPPRACSHADVLAMCNAAINKYFPQPKLRF